MKNYLNLEGLSHFLDNLIGLFVKSNDVIVDDEIDEICGTMLDFDNKLVDNVTGRTYTLYVSEGNLKMTEVTMP